MSILRELKIGLRNRIFPPKFKEYDPTWIVEAAKPYSNEYPWLAQALMSCSSAKDMGYYIYFVDNTDANKPGSKWQFESSITLEKSPRGRLVLDVLKGKMIGGVEMLDEVIDG